MMQLVLLILVYLLLLWLVYEHRKNNSAVVFLLSLMIVWIPLTLLPQALSSMLAKKPESELVQVVLEPLAALFVTVMHTILVLLPS